jgi:hypothetical protein
MCRSLDDVVLKRAATVEPRLRILNRNRETRSQKFTPLNLHMFIMIITKGNNNNNACDNIQLAYNYSVNSKTSESMPENPWKREEEYEQERAHAKQERKTACRVNQRLCPSSLHVTAIRDIQCA